MTSAPTLPSQVSPPDFALSTRPAHTFVGAEVLALPVLPEDEAGDGPTLGPGAAEVGDALGLVQRQVRGDLDRFKEFIEGRERETGSWRGEIRGGHVQPGSPPPPKVPHWPTG